MKLIRSFVYFLIVIFVVVFMANILHSQEFPKELRTIAQPQVDYFCPNCLPPIPAMIYRPQVTYQPYQYQGIGVQPMYYRTPLRSALFGRYRTNYYYAPYNPYQR